MNDEHDFFFQLSYHLLPHCTFVESCKRIYDNHSGAFRRREARLLRMQKPIKIASVRYNYVGTDESFNLFLRNVIKDYLQVDSMTPVLSEFNDTGIIREIGFLGSKGEKP